MIAGQVCRLLGARHILLAGGRDVALAEILAQAAATAGATLHIAAPHPPDRLRTLQREAGDRCVLHQAKPADAIGLLPVPELCWIDADPNYHTVHAILQSLALQAGRLGKPFPATIVQGAGWPNGRRDSYDDPASIPEQWRHPHERAGLLPGQSAPAGAAGLYGDRYNASAENEPNNGVLTAVEDFMDSRTGALRFLVLPGFGGLAVIHPNAGPGAEAFAPPARAQYALAIAAALEATRLDQACALQRLEADVQRAESLANTWRAAAQQADEARQRAEAAIAELRAMLRVRETALQRARALGQTLQAAAPPQVAARARVPVWLRPAAHGVKQLMQGRRPSGAEIVAPPPTEDGAALLRSSPLFDADWYLTAYPDVAAGGLDPVLHYLEHGAAELRDPGPQFSTAYYLSAYQDLAESGLNPLVHYLAYGAAEGRNTRPAPQAAPSPKFGSA